MNGNRVLCFGLKDERSCHSCPLVIEKPVWSWPSMLCAAVLVIQCAGYIAQFGLKWREIKL